MKTLSLSIPHSKMIFKTDTLNLSGTFAEII